MKSNRICRKRDKVDANREKRPVVSAMMQQLNLEYWKLMEGLSKTQSN